MKLIKHNNLSEFLNFIRNNLNFLCNKNMMLNINENFKLKNL